MGLRVRLLSSPVLISDAGVVSGVSSISGNLIPANDLGSDLEDVTHQFQNVYTENVFSPVDVNINNVMV